MRQVASIEKIKEKKKNVKKPETVSLIDKLGDKIWSEGLTKLIIPASVLLWVYLLGHIIILFLR